ncbi:MAG: HAMP domain-containing histidine kinase [Oscillospiraceae bacterium]|jgi:signal transduction histidine kinase|nr:HAMP domain-containing histidine kinase [Oscillospiraceae bacterium]
MSRADIKRAAFDASADESYRGRMSLRYRMSIIILIILGLNALTLSGWYGFVIKERVTEDFSVMQADADATVWSIGETASLSENPYDFLRAEAQRIDANLILRNLEGETLLSLPQSKQKSIWIRASALAEIDGQPCIIEISKGIDLRSFAANAQARSLIWVEIIIICIILLIVSCVVYMLYIRPVEDLDEAVRGYKHGLRPISTDRSDEIGKLQNSFVDLMQDLDEEKSKQSRIIASISHDIKTPLTSVMGYAERIKKGGLSEERAARYVDTIYQKSLAIRDLINEFDDYISCNMRSQYNPMLLTTRDLCSMIESEYRDELASSGVSVSIENRAEEVRIVADISQLRRVFGNIFGNSLKHMENEVKRIEVLLLPKHNALEISVIDNGTGVGEDKLQKIFEPLYTSDVGRSVAGLGLAICKEIVEGHGGKISARNNSYGGLTVVINLPISH